MGKVQVSRDSSEGKTPSEAEVPVSQRKKMRERDEQDDVESVGRGCRKPWKEFKGQ